jgi:hypothetical protein
MTTREQQDVRYWPTPAGLVVLAGAALGASGSLTGPPGSDHFDADGNTTRDYAERLYPGGYRTNLAGQRIWSPPVEECGFCERMLADSECEGRGWHCGACKDAGQCPECNGCPS